ncbi:hypothetical protein [Baekduia soli]|uniref:hypothetical protein n=1 Tax=Baekduia soli TaxID=496014 RepID=UPI001651D526|nr:hypothetical protein [Baekduia soli]
MRLMVHRDEPWRRRSTPVDPPPAPVVVSGAPLPPPDGPVGRAAADEDFGDLLDSISELTRSVLDITTAIVGPDGRTR